MRKSNIKLAVLGYFILAGGIMSVSECAGNGVKALPGHVVFKTDYTSGSSGMGSVEATTAKGVKSGSLLFDEKPTFEIDTMAHTVMGLIIGDGAASVKYQCEGNFPEKKGSVEMVFKPLTWNPDDSLIHMFFQTIALNKSEYGKLFIYKYKNSGLSSYFAAAGGKNKIFTSKKINDWAKGEWHHVVLTYDVKGLLSLYLDGVLAAKRKFTGTASWPRSFSVGPAGRRFGRENGRTTISSVTIYDIVVSPEQVKLLAHDKLPNLKIKLSADEKGAMDGDRIMGKRSEWFTSGKPKLGLEALDANYVPKPWSPIKRDGSKVSVWNRGYVFDGKGVVDSITSSKISLLETPVEIIINGTAVTFAAPEVVETNKGLVKLKHSGEVKGSTTAELLCSVEYDGMVWCDVTVSPQKEIDSLTLKIPVSAKIADFIHYIGAPQIYQSQDLPENSYSKALSTKPGVVFKSGLKTHIWIGNNSAGLMWFTESDQFWWPKEREDCVRVIRKKSGAAELSLDIVAKPLPLKAGEKAHIRFGLMATPVKPMPKGWRGWTFTAQYDAYQDEKRGNHLIYWPNEWRFISLDGDPTRMTLQPTKKKAAVDHKANRKIIPYWTQLHCVARQGNKAIPDAEYMREHWSTNPNRPGGGSLQMFRCATASEWSDYLVWCVDRWGSKVGHLDGWYMDETQPIPNSQKKSLGGYDALDGARKVTFDLLSTRKLTKRLDWIVSRHTGGQQSCSIAHCSATHAMEYLSQYPIMLIGEQYFSGYFQNYPKLRPPDGSATERLYYYSYALPMDRLRTECYWRQWGAVMLFLPCLKNKRDIMESSIPTRDLLSRVMQADMLVWPLFCCAPEIHKMWKFRKEFGIADSCVSFTPYWSNNRITSDDKDVVVGFYSNGKKRLVIVSNLARKPRKPQITFKGIPLRSVVNAETGNTIPHSGNGVSLDMKRNDYIALGVNY
jgi:hypothetical protein